jgi:hypothetical protein
MSTSPVRISNFPSFDINEAKPPQYGFASLFPSPRCLANSATLKPGFLLWFFDYIIARRILNFNTSAGIFDMDEIVGSITLDRHADQSPVGRKSVR